MADPRSAAIARFREAAASEDPRSAATFATEAGWKSRGDSAARLARGVARERHELRVTGPIVESPDQTRAAARTELHVGDKDLDAVWVLLLLDEGAWKVEGATQSSTLVGLFLTGAHSPVVEFDDLPEHPAARAWAEAHLGDDPDLAKVLAKNPGSEPIIAGVRHLGAIQRSAVVFEARKPGQAYGPSATAILHHTPDGVVKVSSAGFPGYDALLDGVQTDLDLSQAKGDSIDTRLQSVLGLLLLPFLRQLGLHESIPAEQAGAIVRFWADESRAGRMPEANLLDPQRMSGVWSSGLSSRVERHVQRRIGEILGEHGIDPDQVDPDGDAGKALLAEHGDAIVRGLLQGVLLASAPGDAADPDEPIRPSTGRWMRAALRQMAERRK